MKKYFPALIVLLLVTSFILNSCQKQTDYSSDINSLKASILLLQGRCDSLATALAATNTNVAHLSTSIDSIKIQLTVITSQITQLDIQLNSANANITAIDAQIVLLNQQYANLLAELNALLAQLSITPTTLSNGLVAYYPFKGNANDSSGNNYNGTVNGATLTTDRFGNANSAYYFNGSSNITTSSFPVNYSTISISGWFKLSSFNTTGGGRIVDHNWPTNTGTFSVSILDTPNRNFEIAYNTTLGQLNCDAYGDTVSLNNWYHFVTTLSNDTSRVYLNDIKVYELVGAGSPSYSNNILQIGGSSIWHFFGAIDDIRIYNRELTPVEIQYLYSH